MSTKITSFFDYSTPSPPACLISQWLSHIAASLLPVPVSYTQLPYMPSSATQKMEAGCSSKTLVNFYDTTWCHVQAYFCLCSHYILTATILKPSQQQICDTCQKRSAKHTPNFYEIGNHEHMKIFYIYIFYLHDRTFRAVEVGKHGA